MKQCNRCRQKKDKSEFSGKSRFCKDCKKMKRNKMQRMSDKCNELHEEVRWKGAVIVKGYKFKGVIPPPKSIDDYIQ